MTEIVNVGVADLKASSNSDILASFGLGSCVAVAIFDPVKQVGGLAHVMLPESRGKDSSSTPGKFADTAVPVLVKRLTDLGARKRSLRCKIVGGAQMFEIPGSSDMNAGLACGPSAHIGARNVEAVKSILDELKIPIVGEDVGGAHGRTVKFDTSSGTVEVSSINYGSSVI